MTMAETISAAPGRSRARRTLKQGTALPVLAVVLALVALWYGGAVWLNAPGVLDRYERAGRQSWTMEELVADTMSSERPVLPAPHQVLSELRRTILDVPVTSRRSLLYHGWVTLSSALLGFVFGTLLGIILAVGIVHIRTLERSLMPWIIASQTIPILAIAPMIIVVLGSLGFVGLVPKAIISAYLCFFPVTIGMVKGLNSPEPIQLDLVRTYNATTRQIFWKLRWPSSLAFLFASLSLLIASLTGKRAFAAGGIVAVFLMTTPVVGVLNVLPSETAHNLSGLVSPMSLASGVEMWLRGKTDLGLDIGRFGPLYGIEAFCLVAAALLLLLARYRKVAGLFVL